ncbi:KilA-N domain-containing protein [Burkholderia gladioli]|uniref:KilA-N domain-containing protein n=1 Tax=Burkholderia gladioli TaxID=28095 RepID=UPI001C2724AB|nr:KilA-N domain-containing protein [Burkholderia gladioli]MBU9379398.1 KilA-N domain-containing protein [Burkholderia gladioli]
MKKENARPGRTESSAVEQRKFTPAIGTKSRTDHSIVADYDGMPVTFTGDGWFNATTAAQRYGKRISHWLENEETQQYTKALATALNVRNSGDLIRTQRGRAGGTWLHPKLAVIFARWCDVHFAVWCDLQIDHILRGGLSVWQKAGDDRSNTNDREPLLTSAAAIVARHRLPFGPVYEALNLFAGVAHAREMTCEQVVESAEFGARLLAGQATPDDFAKIERNRVQLGKASEQLSLIGGVQ